MFNLLHDPVIRTLVTDASETPLALPELYAALMVDSVESFSALRPHQRHAWHALLCQIGAVACLRADLAKPPADANDWRAALKDLTAYFPDDAPWRLVSPLDQPAFLQPVVGPVDCFRPLSTPDELDMLVTAKNHDVKGARLLNALPDDWLFALVSLQTMEGFLGAGNYGVSRMNGGFSNRPGFSLAPPGGLGAHIRRDIEGLIALREKTPEVFDDEGLALVWLEPWDGAASLQPKHLDPYYIEICRRIRLVQQDGRLQAFAAGSKAARIVFGKEAKGLTGDPWTPVEFDNGDPKALTVDARGFSYRRMSEILFEKGFKQAPLQQMSRKDEVRAMVLVARALARGQGKTEGLHERRIVMQRRIVKLLADGQIQDLAIPASHRVEQAGLVRKALRFGLMMLFQNGPDSFQPRDPNSSKRADPFLDRFEADIDSDFFERLFAEVEAQDGAKLEIRAHWLTDLRLRALDLLRTAEAGSPSSSIRRHRAIVRAESAFDNSFYKSFRAPYFPKDEHHDAA
ncbi:CRISPR system Cascade subunit CasA [Rhodoblastus sphagnicola]|uniref:type I-E CRISPR-associated protein Cse1/CasA n=1 Tax=Rhodoblastus sphagnicola TaxID=333368 RepID=UPI0013048118|nr:type I-E CRISPR-associated protein Cse1/CasA [Rhodoblastus sphagnicola]MBB4199539.1 CRISPR system Cascade subunit CasA [Rhodoblastus sphagnicola]